MNIRNILKISLKIKILSFNLFFLLSFPFYLFSNNDLTNKAMLLQALNDIKISLETKNISLYTQQISPQFFKITNSISINNLESKIFYSLLIESLKKKNFDNFKNAQIKIHNDIIDIGTNNIKFKMKILINKEKNEKYEETDEINFIFKRNEYNMKWYLIDLTALKKL